MSVRSDQAEAIIRSRLFQDIFQDLKQDCYNKWLNSKKTEEREELHREVQTIANFQVKLEAALQEGIYEATMTGDNHEK